MSDLPRIYVARRLPQPALNLLSQHTRMTLWPGELPPPRAVLMKEVAEVDGLLALLTDRVDGELLDAAPSLRVVSNYAVGYDNVDVPAATARRVLVTNTPDVLTETTADFAFALMLAVARRLGEAERYVKTGQWRTWGPEILLGRDLYGATLGIVGMGRIGRAVAKRARGFDMRVLYYSATRRPQDERPGEFEYASLAQLLAESDFISLHCPLNNDTYHLIDKAALELLKPGAVLINTARGPVIDTRALVEALRQKPIFAALDVTDPEPLPADHPLIELPNAMVVPHIASATVQTRTRMAMMAAENLLAALRGERPRHLVNPQAWHE